MRVFAADTGNGRVLECTSVIARGEQDAVLPVLEFVGETLRLK